MNKNNQILLIYDLAGYGKVALSVMIPIFSHLRCETFNLPTALVSNTFDYGKFDILDTTGYMRNTISVWKELGFSFDAICTGFIASEEQSSLIFDYCTLQKREKGTRIFVDPVMGDGGVLYNGVSQANIFYMRKMCAIADVILPNVTEAALLTDTPISRDSEGKMCFSEDNIDSMVATLREQGAKDIVITSANINGKACTIVAPYHGDSASSGCAEGGFVRNASGKEAAGAWKALYYDEIPAQFSGTGDTFTSLVTANIMNGTALESAVAGSMKIMEHLISINAGNPDKYKGIPIEQYLSEIHLV